jgi:hypothetical protein
MFLKTRGMFGEFTELTKLWNASKIHIAATTTNVYDRTYIISHVYSSNFKQPIRFLHGNSYN